MSNADLLLFLQNRDTFCNSSVCALQCLSKTTMCVIRDDDGRFSVIFQILIRKTKNKFCALPHHESAKLPWYHNIKLSFWSLYFFLFVFFSRHHSDQMSQGLKHWILKGVQDKAKRPKGPAARRLWPEAPRLQVWLNLQFCQVGPNTCHSIIIDSTLATGLFIFSCVMKLVEYIENCVHEPDMVRLWLAEAYRTLQYRGPASVVPPVDTTM